MIHKAFQTFRKRRMAFGVGRANEQLTGSITINSHDFKMQMLCTTFSTEILILAAA